MSSRPPRLAASTAIVLIEEQRKTSKRATRLQNEDIQENVQIASDSCSADPENVAAVSLDLSRSSSDDSDSSNELNQSKYLVEKKNSKKDVASPRTPKKKKKKTVASSIHSQQTKVNDCVSDKSNTVISSNSDEIEKSNDQRKKARAPRRFPKKKKKSWVWRFFVLEEKSAVCMICQ